MKHPITNLNNVFTFEEKRNRQARPIQYEKMEHGCQICVSHDLDKDGYPRNFRNGKYLVMSRYIWSQVNGREIPPGMIIMHTCDNTSCINPTHLKLGTHTENMFDRTLKGRTLKGVKHGKSQFKNEYDVYFIKFISEESHQELAARFNVSVDTIKNIRFGKSWKWLTIDNYLNNVA